MAVQELFLGGYKRLDVISMIILRFLAAILIFYVLYRMIRWLFLSSAKPAEPIPSRQRPEIAEDLVEDPCCHAYLPAGQAYRASIDGKEECFCSEKCYKAFVEKRKAGRE
jgi:YHS domain-containing protein